jgi:hypothetical protein
MKIPERRFVATGIDTTVLALLMICLIILGALLLVGAEAMLRRRLRRQSFAVDLSPDT